MRGEPIDTGQIIGSSAVAQALLAPYFAGLTAEVCHILYLDGAHRLLRHSVIAGDVRGSVDLPLRRIIRDALARDAGALILAHNHPDGDPTPSRADKIATRRLAEIAAPLNLALLDHLIFAGERHVSFRALGLL